MSQILTRYQRRILRALQPCESPPGSPGRIETYRRRAALGLPLFSPLKDAELQDAEVLIPQHAVNGELMARHRGIATHEGIIQVETAPESSEPPRPIRPSVAAGKYDPEYRAREAERKRRERARKRREREERLPAA